MIISCKKMSKNSSTKYSKKGSKEWLVNGIKIFLKYREKPKV